MSSQHDFPYTYEGLLQLLKRLRGPDGCPWDGDQTHESLKAQFLEECYELIEAIEQNDTQQIIEELGDVFYHVLFQVDIAEKNGEFEWEQVFKTLIDKLVRRHPHVFGDGAVDRFLVATAGAFDVDNIVGGGFVGGFDPTNGEPVGLPLDFILRERGYLLNSSPHYGLWTWVGAASAPLTIRA